MLHGYAMERYIYMFHASRQNASFFAVMRHQSRHVQYDHSEQILHNENLLDIRRVHHAHLGSLLPRDLFSG